MGLQSLSVRHFRNIAACDIQFSSGLNCIEGPNAAGKTSLLESVFLLGRARSFRTRHADQLVQSGRDGFLVQGRLTSEGGSSVPVGIERTRRAQQIRLNGMPLRKISELVERFPLQIVNPESHELVEGGPRLRRRYLDWGVFHVEPGFFGLWQRYVKALRQRNAALRQGQRENQILAWDENLIEVAERLHELRQDYIRELSRYLDARIEALLQLEDFILGYYPGWPREEPYGEALRRTVQRDREQGYTQFGPHRADLKLKVDNRVARERLSRGQQKLLAISMLVAQAQFFRERTGRSTTFLVDDLAAELDRERRASVLRALRDLGAQLLVTALDADTLEPAGWTELRTFHVEHGAFTEVVY